MVGGILHPVPKIPAFRSFEQTQRHVLLRGDSGFVIHVPNQLTLRCRDEPGVPNLIR